LPPAKAEANIMKPMIRVTAFRAPVISVSWLPAGVRMSLVALSWNLVRVLGIER
jgi:hypothetical protein